MRSINILLAICMLSICACTQTEPTKINEAPMLSKVSASETILRNDNDLQEVADMWQRSGQSPVDIVATYSEGNQGIASSNAQTAAMRLKALGVTDVQTTLLPAANNEVIASMKTLTAGAVSSCLKTPETGEMDDDYDYASGYRLGCGVDKFMGMQVARTGDLEGRVAGQGYGNSTDAQRQANIVDVYRTGKPSEPLEGLVSSDIAEGK